MGEQRGAVEGADGLAGSLMVVAVVLERRVEEVFGEAREGSVA